MRDLQRLVEINIKKLQSLTYQNIIDKEKLYKNEQLNLPDKIKKTKERKDYLLGNLSKKENEKEQIEYKAHNKILDTDPEIKDYRLPNEPVEPTKENFETYLISLIVASIIAYVLPYNVFITWFICFGLINFISDEFYVKSKIKLKKQVYLKEIKIYRSKKEILDKKISYKKNKIIDKSKLDKLIKEIKELKKKIDFEDLEISRNEKSFLFVNEIIPNFEQIKQRAKERERSAKIAAFDNRARSGSQTVKQDLLKGMRNKSNWKCPYCYLGKNIDTSVADHIYPVNKGGLSTPQNIVLICNKCNSKKSNKTLRVFCKNNSFDFNEVSERLERLGKDV